MSVNHVVMRNQNLFCEHCGDSRIIAYPISIPDMTATSNDFVKRHKNCKKTWVEPTSDGLTSEHEKAKLWMQVGEHGISSKTIFSILAYTVGLPPMLQAREFHTPCDPGDFNRCSKLIAMVPEWKGKLNIVANYSPVWKNLVDNWDKLEEMLKENLAIGANGMYEFMKELGC
jgi:hypothetical protein